MSEALDINVSNTDQHPPRGATATLHAILADLRDRDQSATRANADTQAEAKASFGDVIDRLDERAFGLLLLLLALPCTLPFIYLLPQLVALPMLALAGQMVAGREHPWLPKKLHDREFAISGFESVLTRAGKYVGWFEKLSTPRLTALTNRTGARVIGLLLLAPTASILVPLPSTNTVPGIGVAITAVGLIERDGLLVLLGLAIGFAWIGLLAFFGLEAASLIKDWLSGLL